MREENPEIKDRELLKKACREACMDSLSIIYQKYRKPVCDYLHKAGADGFAEDICQDVFARINENRCDYDGSSDVRDYLFGIAANILSNHRRIKTEVAFPPDQIESLDSAVKTSSVPDAESVAVSGEDFNRIKVDILKLSPKLRQAIEIWLQNGSFDKLTSQDQSSHDPNTLRARLSYAIRCLKKNINNI